MKRSVVINFFLRRYSVIFFGCLLSLLGYRHSVAAVSVVNQVTSANASIDQGVTKATEVDTLASDVEEAPNELLEESDPPISSDLDSLSVATQQDSVAVDSLADTVETAPLSRPAPLQSLPLDRLNPLETIDHLVVKRVIVGAPFVPLCQEVTLGCEVFTLLRDSWNLLKNIKKYSIKRDYTVEFTASVLFRWNVRLAVDGGYSSLYPDKLRGNENNYRTEGNYFALGVDYVFPYALAETFYVGSRYGMAFFKNFVLPGDTYAKNLTASWVELLVGAESGLWQRLNIYGGCCLKWAFLNHANRFGPAENNYIPGYGFKQNASVPIINIYLLYKVSFLERLIKPV